MDFYYQNALSLGDISVLSPDSMQSEILKYIAEGWRLLTLCGLPQGAIHTEDKGICLLCILADDQNAMFKAMRTKPLTSYTSFTPKCPQVHLFEREIYEQYNINIQGHPWLKPVRSCPPLNNSLKDACEHEHANSHKHQVYSDNSNRLLPDDSTYFTVSGEEVHEVAVGPVHAGVIEPGHFRFQCYGENVMHLEIQLGYQHRAMEKQLMAGPNVKSLRLVECIAGDSSIAHTTAYCNLLEIFIRSKATKRGQAIRRIALELERLANHTGDLGALSGDVGYLPTAAWCGRIRGDFLNMTALLCGNRFGRGLICHGGVVHDLNEKIIAELKQKLVLAQRDVRGAIDVMFSSALVRARFKKTGTISAQIAHDLGMVGVAAKACGLNLDARFYYSKCATPNIFLRTAKTGDVYARALVRSMEIDDSINIIFNELNELPSDACSHDIDSTLPPQRLAVALVEGFRGTVCHIALSDAHGVFSVYKPIDPSFYNWMGLSMALRDQQISDFPLCNKSFNLSYCGHDL